MINKLINHEDHEAHEELLREQQDSDHSPQKNLRDLCVFRGLINVG